MAGRDAEGRRTSSLASNPAALQKDGNWETHKLLPNEAMVFVNLLDVFSIDTAEQSFELGIYIHCETETQADTTIRIEMLNMRKEEARWENYNVDPEREERYMTHLKLNGTFTSRMKLKTFPVDRQLCKIMFEVWRKDTITGETAILTPRGVTQARLKDGMEAWRGRR